MPPPRFRGGGGGLKRKAGKPQRSQKPFRIARIADADDEE